MAASLIRQQTGLHRIPNVETQSRAAVVARPKPAQVGLGLVGRINTLLNDETVSQS
jgi:hypothetical protein